jgi:hypothetical protein
VHADDDPLRGRLSHDDLQTSLVLRTLSPASVRPARAEGRWAVKITPYGTKITRRGTSRHRL